MIAFPAPLVTDLRAALRHVPDRPDALVFASRNGTPLDADNLRSRVLKPVAEEARAGWAGFRTLRHTFASMRIAAGVNVSRGR